MVESVPHWRVQIEQPAEGGALVAVDGPGEPEHGRVVVHVAPHARYGNHHRDLWGELMWNSNAMNFRVVKHITVF